MNKDSDHTVIERKDVFKSGFTGKKKKQIQINCDYFPKCDPINTVINTAVHGHMLGDLFLKSSYHSL